MNPPPTARSANAFTALVISLILAFSGSDAGAAQQLLVIGDSLSKEYYYQKVAIGGENAGDIMSWGEILHDRRNSHFDLGPRDNYPEILRFQGHRSNWSMPGSFAEDWVEYLDYENLDPRRYTFGVDELEGHVNSGTERVVIFLGGNNIRVKYEDLYRNIGGSATAWVNEVYSYIVDVVEWVLARNNSMEMVLVSVPHIGCTPKVNAELPYDPLKTGRVTTALNNLNSKLATFAGQKRIGWCPDIYNITLGLLTTDSLCIGGVPIWKNPPKSDGNPRYLFLGDGFHPNMPCQAVFAQRILDTFNTKYNRTISRLTNAEILVNVLGLRTDQVFDDWTKSHNLPSGERGTMDDFDRDGIKNLLEFVLNLNPKTSDAKSLPQPRLVPLGGQPHAELTWTPLPQACATAEIIPQYSTNLTGWQTIPAANVITNPNGSKTARLPLALFPPPLYLRLKAQMVPAD